VCDGRGRVSVKAIEPGVLVGFRGIGGGVGDKEVVQSACCERCSRIWCIVSQRLDSEDRTEQEETHLPRQPRSHCSRRVLPSVVYRSISIG
jgi:hypothetical protein